MNEEMSYEEEPFVMLCSSERTSRFGGMYHFHLLSRRVNRARNQQKQQQAEPQIQQYITVFQIMKVV
jgi:hypothetical protein